MLYYNKIVKTAKRKHIIKVLPRDRDVSGKDMAEGIDDVIKIDKDYDDWLLENCDLLVGDASNKFYESDLLKKAEAAGKQIICIRCDFLNFQ